MKIAYLASEYPLVTHTFIRRELLGVESCGITVSRISIRNPSLEKITNKIDFEEYSKTYFILAGKNRIILDFFTVLILHPVKWFKVFFTALKWGIRNNLGVMKHCAYFIEACTLFRYTIKEKIEHIHVHFGTNPATVAYLTHKLGGPQFSIMIHGPGEFDSPEGIHLSEKIESAKFITCISSFARSQVYRNSSPDYWEKVHIVRCGVDEDFLAQPIMPVPCRNTLVNVGRLGRSKAHELIIKASHKLLAGGMDFELIIIGDGELRTRLEDLIKRLGVQEKIKLVGWKTSLQIRDYLQQSRGLLLPSFGEGLPVVIMESLALGRPVITTSIAGIPELVKDGENGWLIPAGDEDHIANAIKDILSKTPDELTEMGRIGKDAVRLLHDSSKESSRLVELLKEYSPTHGT